MYMSITMINAFFPRSLNVIYLLHHTRQPTHIIHHVAFFIRPLLPPHFGQWKVGDHDAGKSSPTRGYETARNVIRRSGPTSRRHTPPPHPPLHDGCINAPSGHPQRLYIYIYRHDWLTKLSSKNGMPIYLYMD